MTSYLTSKYPLSKDTNDFIEVIDGVTEIDSILFGKVSSSILAIEKELGIKPSGVYSDVRQRLDALQNSLQLLSANTATHSTTIGTYFLHNWLSTTTVGGIVEYTKVARLTFNPIQEAGFADGYGKYYFKASFTIDADINNFEISLWDVTVDGLDYQLTSSSYSTAGYHSYSYTIDTPLSNTDKVYEVRVKQTTTISSPTKVASVIWNTRLLFVPFVTNSGSGSGSGGIKYITAELLTTDFAAGSKLIGTIPAGSIVQSVVLVVKTAFDGLTKIDIGDDVTNNCLMDKSCNIPTIIETYSYDCNIAYAKDTQAKVFLSGTPEVGSATIIIYFH